MVAAAQAREARPKKKRKESRDAGRTTRKEAGKPGQARVDRVEPEMGNEKSNQKVFRRVRA